MAACKIQELKQNLTTLSSLGSRLSARRSQTFVDSSLSKTDQNWRDVLDNLSWLGDYLTGGKTVSSLAAASTESGITYWLATNHRPQLSIKRYLERVLNQLHSCVADRESDPRHTRQALYLESIVFSHRRVENYYGFLSGILKHIHSDLNEHDDLLLIEYLDKLISLRDQHEQLCHLAAKLRIHPSYARLKHHMLSGLTAPMWKAVRHYIGRLGSWWIACTNLVSAAGVNPEMFLNCQIKLISTGISMECMLAAQEAGGSAFRSASGKPTVAHQYHERIEGTKDNVRARLRHMGRMGNQNGESYIHAELLLLNHFYRQNLAFADGVRYIGCSKPSCYSCHIYMEMHPMGVLARPCHGNAWPGWAMPVSLMMKSGELSSQDKQLLESMLRHTQFEIEQDLPSNTTVRALESTTGMSEATRAM